MVPFRDHLLLMFEQKMYFKCVLNGFTHYFRKIKYFHRPRYKPLMPCFMFHSISCKKKKSEEAQCNTAGQLWMGGVGRQI